MVLQCPFGVDVSLISRHHDQLTLRVFTQYILANCQGRVVSDGYQRFKSESFPAGFRIMKFDEPLAQIYNDDEFKLMYLSLTNTPNSSTDWGFVDRQEDSLIEISGGRRR